MTYRHDLCLCYGAMLAVLMYRDKVIPYKEIGRLKAFHIAPELSDGLNSCAIYVIV